MRKEKATFAMGCFWGPDYIFSRVQGVLKTRVGYIGGKTKNPTYEEVCKGDTGHAESIEIEFDADKISYEKLLDVFWKNHDSTTINRQGPDVGSQYRSVIFYHNDTQKKAAEKSKKEKQKELVKKIVTEILKAERFYEAEEYHQKYADKHGGKYVCHI